jgi:hypothetical protein
MASRVIGFFKQNADSPVLKDHTKEPVPKNHAKEDKITKDDKIHAFNSIVSILAQIQQPGSPFNEITDTKPRDLGERLQLKLSNAFAHLAVANTDVVAATLYTPKDLTLLAWIQDQNSSDDQPGADQDTKKEPESKSVWDNFYWLFSCNTRNHAMRAGSKYPGPCITDATPPMDYPEGDSKETLLQYLNNFPKKW